MTPDEWQAHLTREAALEIGRWLEARGRLQSTVASLTLGDLEAMASNGAKRDAFPVTPQKQAISFRFARSLNKTRP